MKKLYLFLPLLCLMPAACSTSVVNEPETETHAINFRTPQAETRAVVDDTSLPGDFLVWGGYDGDATRVFDGTTVYHPDWDYRDGMRYWTEGKLYDFYAVYPTELPTGSTASVSKEGIITVSGFDCTATGKDAVDLMTATAPNVSADKMIQDNSAVELKFEHELARVTCDVKSEKSTVTIKSVKLYGVGYKGTLTKTAGNAVDWSDVATYTADDTPFKKNEEFNLNTTSGLEKDNVLDDLLLLPQDLKATAQFSLTYRYNNDTADRTAAVSFPTGSEWTAGQHYNYTLTLKAATVTLNVAVLDWEEENTSVSWGDDDTTTTP